jgi:surface polysaccharide O-acyltransferase-like enzyme
VPIASGYIGFYVLGYLLGRISFPSWAVITSLVTWVLSSFSTVVGTYVMTSEAGKFVDFFYDYLNITVVVASVSAFIVLRRFAEYRFMNHTVIAGLISKIATVSFGIYLVHALVLDLIGGYFPLIHFNTSLGNPAWSIILVSVIAFVVSYGAVYFLQKIPLLNRLVP